MASLGELMVSVGADISDFSTKMKTVDKNMKDVGKSMQSAGKSMTNAGMKMATSVTAPLLALGAGVLVVGANFDKEMSRVSAISGATGTSFEKLRKQAIKLGAKTAWSATESAQGMSELASAGYSVEQIMATLPSVLNLASAGGLSIAESASIATEVMAGFGIKASKAGQVMDVLAKASADSNTGVHALGESFKMVAPVAGSLGLSVEEVSATLGLMANAGIKGSQAGTALRAGLLRLSSPTKEASEKMNALGLEMFNANGEMKPLPAVFKELESGLKGMSDKQKVATLSTIFGQEAVAGFMGVLGYGSGKLKTFTSDLKNSDGASKKMAKTMNDNLAGAWDGLMGSLESLAIGFSTVLTPAIRKVTEFMTKVVGKFGKASPAMKKVIVVVAGLVAGIAPLLIVVGLVASGIGALVTAIGAISAPVVAVIAIIVAFGVALTAMWTKSKTFRTIVTKVFNAIKTKIQQAIGVVVTFLKAKFAQIKQFWNQNGTQILQAVKNVFNGIKAVISFVMPAVLAVIKFVWNAIKGVINGALNVIMGLVKVFSGLFTGNFSSMWKGVKQLFKGAIQFVWNLMNLSFVGGIKKLVFSFVKSIWKKIGSLWDTVKVLFMYGKDKVVGIVTKLKSTAVKVFNALKNGVMKIVKLWWKGVKAEFKLAKKIITTIFNAIKSVAKTIWNAIKSGITAIVNAIKSVISSVFNAIKNIISSIFSGIKSVASSIWNGIKSTISGVVNGIKSKVSSVFNSMKSKVSGVFNGIKSTATSVWNGIKNAITKPIEKAKDTVMGIIDTIKGAFSKMKIKIPKPKLPSVSVNMKKNSFGIPFPDFDVDWHAKGAMFNGASILGGHGIGEQGKEVVMPVQHKRYMRPFARAVADNMEGMTGTKGGDVQQHFHFAQGAFTVREEADIDRIAKELLNKQKRTNRSL